MAQYAVVGELSSPAYLPGLILGATRHSRHSLRRPGDFGSRCYEVRYSSRATLMEKYKVGSPRGIVGVRSITCIHGISAHQILNGNDE